MKFFKLSIVLSLEKTVQNIDQKYYSVLGVLLKLINSNKQIYSNLSVSPLYHYQEQEYIINLSFFNQESYQNFLNYFNSQINKTVNIDGLPFKISGFIIPGEGQIFDLEKESKIIYKNYKWIKLHFISPTVVKHSPTYRLLPLPEFYIYSLLNRFNTILWEEKFFELFSFKLSKKIKALLQDWLIESSYKLEIEKVFIKWWFVPGNIWIISYAINKNFQDPVFQLLQEKLPIFIKWAFWTWLWFGTRLGLWQVKWEIY